MKAGFQIPPSDTLTAKAARQWPRVAMFADAYGLDARDCDLGAILDAIRDGKYAAQICNARQRFEAWRAVCPTLDCKKSSEAQAYERFKKTLPAFCVSGTAKSRTEPLEHSGLLQVDCDKLNGTADALREKLKGDPYVAFGFISPSGDGLKLGLAIDGTRHLESFEAARRYFRSQYGVEIDPAVKDRLRLCFVSHDPDLWTSPDAAPLPVQDCEPKEPEPESTGGAEMSGIVLPSGSVTISESARVIFQRIAPRRTLFWRGGALVELVMVDGVAGLEVLKPEKFRSDAEKIGPLFAWRAAGTGEPALKPSKMSLDDAKAILAASEARDILPSVASVLRCPVLIEAASGEIAILGRGYHPELGGLLIVDGDTPPQEQSAEAVENLHRLIDEFDFQSEGDRSRALAAFITPALRIGGFLSGPVPIDCAEADQSQSGKGYRHALVSAVYNESAYTVTVRQGGVGSMDESFAAALISGRPFVQLDNLRGRLDSQHLESFLTSPGLFPARVPHRGEVLINPRRFILQMSSNGLEATRDLANRASICRIRKRHGFQYRDTLGELQRRQPYFLGCVFAVVAEWIANGKPRTNDSRHDFREWDQTLDWIVQRILGCAPLMDGHVEAQERTSNPGLSWLRAVALAVAAENRLGVPLIASELVEVCELHAVEVPGKPSDEDRAKQQVGSLCKRVFRDSDIVTVDGFTVTRGRKEYRKPGQ
ncbi:MAG: BT4734/BF3469 family protein [Limisphaerales bacterium]